MSVGSVFFFFYVVKGEDVFVFFKRREKRVWRRIFGFEDVE